MNWICRTPALHMPTSIQMIGIPQIIANLKVVTPYIYFGSQHCGWLPYALKTDNYQHMIQFLYFVLLLYVKIQVLLVSY